MACRRVVDVVAVLVNLDDILWKDVQACEEPPKRERRRKAERSVCLVIMMLHFLEVKCWVVWVGNFVVLVSLQNRG